MSSSGLKRTASASSDATAIDSSKRSKLEGYFHVPAPKRPSPFGISDPLIDRDSVFVAYAGNCENTVQAKQLRDYVVEQGVADYRDDEPSHVMQGTRWLAPKAYKSEDFEVKTAAIDDGETKGGRTIVDALAKANAVDVTCCVARWFGGTMLGPKRFTDIEQAATQALYRLRDDEEVVEIRETLEKNDAEIQNLLVELHRKEGKLAPPAQTIPDYEILDLARAKRLQTARTLRISNLRGRIAKLDKQEAEEESDLPEVPGRTLPKVSPQPQPSVATP